MFGHNLLSDLEIPVWEILTQCYCVIASLLKAGILKSMLYIWWLMKFCTLLYIFLLIWIQFLTGAVRAHVLSNRDFPKSKR
jgi:hypothetical protein